MVALNEEFDSSTAQWINYDAYDQALRTNLRQQKHIDIRNFRSNDVTAPLNVLELSRYYVNDLSGLTMDQIAALKHAIKKGEHWTLAKSLVNIIPNPSFETNTTGWGAGVSAGATVDLFARQTGWSAVGTAALRVTGTNGADTTSRRISAGTPTGLSGFVVEPNTTYSAQATVNILDAAPQGFRLVFAWYKSDGTPATVASATSSFVAIGTTGVVTLSLTAIAPADAAFGHFRVDGQTNVASDTVDYYVDAVAVVAHGTPIYFDGNMPASDWTGTANNSTSIEIVETVPLPSHNSWHVLSTPLKTNSTTVVTSITDPINLLDSFENDDLVSLTLPDWPGSASVSLAGSFLDLTSNPTGDFAVGPTASVSLDTSINSLVAGANAEGRWLRSAFNAINLASVTGVRLRLAGQAVTTAYLGALRMLSKDWKYGTLDIDTRFGILVRPISLNGDPAAATEFEHPIVWRAAEIPSEEDPKPIDFNLAVGFNTGSQQGTNQIIVYGRELTEDFMQQIDLNGLTQASLTGHDQPDVGAAMYNERVQSDLSPFKQEQLSGLTQYDLERTPDYLAASWIEFVLSWSSTTTQLSVVNTEGDGYNFNLGTPLTANKDYVLVFELEDTTARAAIYPLGPRGEILSNAPVFDSTQIDDDFSYKRRKGRVGWYANLQDGDAHVESIRFRSASYAEYRSLPYESLTPVVGAELSAESSPVIDLFEWFAPTLETIKVERDNELSTTGSSWRVTDYGPYAFQGIQSNPFPITDFNQTEILLDVHYPFAADLEASVEFYLKSETNYLVPLPRLRIYPDQWQTIRLRTPSSHLAQTGLYRLVAVQNRPVNLNWWIDNVRIFERTVSWHGRAYVEDPWAETEDDWTPFQNAFNRDYGGILFQGRERRLQVKGVGHKQDATISKVQFKPKYAELGRFIWEEDELSDRLPPVASYATSNNGRLYTFDGFGSSDPDGMVINWYWTVSDGSVYVGPIIQHTFGAAGTYAVTLMVTDHNGLIHTTSAMHSVA